MEQEVILARKGDQAAFVRIIEVNKASMYRVAKSILNADEDIGDAIQETILKAYKGIDKLNNPQYFKTWLIRILINECNSLLKKRGKLVFFNELRDEGYMDRYENSEVISAINSLEEEFRVVTMLFYYEDMSIGQISAIVNIPEGTVKSRLSRARVKLYNLLKGEGEGVYEG